MASYQEHIGFAAGLGFAYGGIATRYLETDTATGVLATIVTTVGGMLPDLDSDSGVPVRELFGLAAAVMPLMMFQRLMQTSLTPQEILVVLILLYAIIRYGLSQIFKRITVHRGMFHSIPAMFIAGMLFFLQYHDPSLRNRLVLMLGVMIGFLSHLLLDEIYSVNFEGVRFRLAKSAGSALKFWSSSWPATAITYLILFAVTVAFLRDIELTTNKEILPELLKPDLLIRLR